MQQRARHHLHPCHPHPARGDRARRSRRGDGAGQDQAGRCRRATSTPIRTTAMSPSSRRTERAVRPGREGRRRELSRWRRPRRIGIEVPLQARPRPVSVGDQVDLAVRRDDVELVRPSARDSAPAAPSRCRAACSRSNIRALSSRSCSTPCPTTSSSPTCRNGLSSRSLRRRRCRHGHMGHRQRPRSRLTSSPVAQEYDLMQISLHTQRPANRRSMSNLRRWSPSCCARRSISPAPISAATPASAAPASCISTALPVKSCTLAGADARRRAR